MRALQGRTPPIAIRHRRLKKFHPASLLQDFSGAASYYCIAAALPTEVGHGGGAPLPREPAHPSAVGRTTYPHRHHAKVHGPLRQKPEHA
jgi:hypothetical protein